MSTVFTVHCRFSEDGSATLLGRVTSRDGTGAVQSSGRKLLKQADLSSVTWKVFDLSSAAPDTAIVSATLTIASVIFDTLQTDWDVDTTGYTFKYDVASTVFTEGGHEYQAEVKFTTTGGTVAWGRWKGRAEPVRSS